MNFHLASRLLLALFLASLLACHHAVRCSMERPRWQGTKGGLQSIVFKELNLANKHMSSHLEVDPPQLSLLMRLQLQQTPGLQPMRALKHRTLLSHAHILDPQKLR